jgi:hypothetical protein
MFHAAWEDDDVDSYNAMVRAAWDLLTEADVVVSWNGDRFDVHHFNAAFGRLELGPPAPYRSLDLIKVVKKHFKHGEMSQKLDWFSWQWLGDRKTRHGEYDLWEYIRYGTPEQRAKAQRKMRIYNCQDVKLTDQLFDRLRPWTGVNFALYDPSLDDTGRLERCTKCGSEKIHSRGKFHTTAYSYERFYCTECKGWSRGRKFVFTTELRPA